MNKKVDEEIVKVRDVIEYRLTLTFPNGVPAEEKRPICLNIFESDYKKFDLDRETFGSILYVMKERGIVAPKSRPCEQDDFIDDDGYEYEDTWPMFFVFLKEDPATDITSPSQPITAPRSENIIFQLKTDGRRVLLNGYVLRTPHFNKLNHRFYEYMLQHPNEVIAKSTIEKELKEKFTKKMANIVQDLGFEGEVKRMFFSVSQDSIILRNPVLQEDIDRLGIEKIDLEDYVKALRNNGNNMKSKKKK